MTKPPLGKVEALLYVLQHVTKRGCARIMTHPLVNYIRVIITPQRLPVRQQTDVDYQRVTELL